MWYAIIAVWLVSVLLVLGLCRAAQEGDRKLAQWHRDTKGE